MADHHKPTIRGEVLEESDKLAHVRKDPLGVSFVSTGTSKRSKCENRLRFSIRGSSSVALNVKTKNSSIWEQEVSSGKPPTVDMMAELLENSDEEIEDSPSEFAHPTKTAIIPVAELLEDLYDRSDSSVRRPFALHQQSRATEGKPKVPSSEKKILGFLGQRNLNSEEPLEYAIGETSSEEEDSVQNNLTIVSKDVKGQSMADLFQEAFNATSMEISAVPMRSTGAGYYGRMQHIMQMEKDKHTEFSRQYNEVQNNLGDSKAVTVEILSRSLEGKLTVCNCLFKEKSNFPFTSKVPTNCDLDSKRTIIFSHRICDNVDLVAGNTIHIYPPWKEVKVKDEEVILCTYFSHHGA